MFSKIVFVLAEGAHDAAFIEKILKASNFRSYSKVIGEYPELLRDYFHRTMNTVDIEELKLDQLRGKLLPSSCLSNDDVLYCVFSVGGVTESDRRAVIFNMVRDFMAPDEDAFEVAPELELSIGVLIDADEEGVGARLEQISKEVSSVFSGPAITFDDNRQILSLSRVNIGVYIITEPESQYGKLEDILLPVMQEGNEDVFEYVNQFLRIHSETKIYKEGVTRNEDGFPIKVHGKKYDLKKSIVGAAGQLHLSGKSNVVCIKESCYLNNLKLTENKVCKDLLGFIGQL